MEQSLYNEDPAIFLLCPILILFLIYVFLNIPYIGDPRSYEKFLIRGYRVRRIIDGNGVIVYRAEFRTFFFTWKPLERDGGRAVSFEHYDEARAHLNEIKEVIDRNYRESRKYKKVIDKVKR